MVCCVVWIGLVALAGCSHKPTFVHGGLDQYQYHPVTMDFNGPMLREMVGPEIANPFIHYRMNVRFTQNERVITVPGYFAADGKAADTSATDGHVWRVHFLPDQPGEWEYEAELLYGVNAAVDESARVTRVSFSGAKGKLTVKPVSGKATGFYRTGPIRYADCRYLRFDNGQPFLINGLSSPENFLAYVDFDGTQVADQFLHHFLPHLRDWVDEQPAWQNGKGKGIIGAVNYLASQGVNCLSFSTYNIDGGNHEDVWVWSTPADKAHFDVSKLAQWNIVFTHMARLGVAMQLVTQEAGNNNILGKGQLRDERKLYYRELVARFAHHPGLIWNLGQANTNSDRERTEFAAYIRHLDPYGHPIVIHAADGDQMKVFTPLLGFHALDGGALQADPDQVCEQTRTWTDRSAEHDHKWIAVWNNQADDNPVMRDDMADPSHDAARRGLWANLLAGGSGTIWSLGTEFPGPDPAGEDFRRYENLWKQGRIAVTFLRKYVPITHMKPANDAVKANGTTYCLAGPNVYLVYLAQGQSAKLNVAPGRYEVVWLNPRTGALGPANGHGATNEPQLPQDVLDLMKELLEEEDLDDDAATSKDQDVEAIHAVETASDSPNAVTTSTGELLLTPPTNNGKDWVVFIRVWK